MGCVGGVDGRRRGVCEKADGVEDKKKSRDLCHFVAGSNDRTRGGQEREVGAGGYCGDSSGGSSKSSEPKVIVKVVVVVVRVVVVAKIIAIVIVVIMAIVVAALLVPVE